MYLCFRGEGYAWRSDGEGGKGTYEFFSRRFPSFFSNRASFWSIPCNTLLTRTLLQGVLRYMKGLGGEGGWKSC
jgi:hypothetical protein